MMEMKYVVVLDEEEKEALFTFPKSAYPAAPCNDCVDYGGEREAFQFAKDAIEATQRDCEVKP